MQVIQINKVVLSPSDLRELWERINTWRSKLLNTEVFPLGTVMYPVAQLENYVEKLVNEAFELGVHIGEGGQDDKKD